MPTLGEGMLGVIQAEIDQARQTVLKMGTIAQRDSTGPLAMVVFDGSSGTAQRVKCFEDVLVSIGDRVGVGCFQGEWIILGNYTLRGLADELQTYTWTGTNSLSATTYTDMPGVPGLTYVKMRDSTIMEYRVECSTRNNTSACQVQFGLRVTKDDLTVDYDQDVRRIAINALNVHTHFAQTVRAASAHAAGNYTAVARWFRATGTDTPVVDTLDTISFSCREVWP
jgi:hypothetical protein